jgi:tRNA(Arg) A34 adenosine deaminase TadA
MYENYMRRAIALSCQGVETGGGPFGAVVVKDGEIIGEGMNQVVPHADPTAHAEIVAIRAACAALGTHDLAGAVIVSSCEPCPMCLGAIWWSRIGLVVYGNDRADAPPAAAACFGGRSACRFSVLAGQAG